MMGTKKLSTIKAELSAALRKEGLDEAWLAEQLRKLDRRSAPNRASKETISALRGIVSKSRARSRKRKTRVRS